MSSLEATQVHLKTLHPNQVKMYDHRDRWNLLKCGRRFGKTEFGIFLAIEPMKEHYPVGWWSPTYKDLHEVWNELKFVLYPIIESKDETVKQLSIVGGGKIDFWSMEDPNSGRGRKYKRAIVDECEKASKFEEAWKQSIRPTLTDYEGDAWFMSTPKFGQTYFKKLAQEAPKKKGWKAWKFTTYDNPYINPKEVDEARNQLDDLTFRCEYLAEDVDLTANPFAYAFDQAKHVRTLEYDPAHYLHISYDFNVDPITAIASQYIDGQIRIIKEFRLSNSNIYELCDRINATYPNAVYLVTGDATGQNRSALTVGNINYYHVIRQKLRLNDGQLRVPSVNPAVSDSRVLTNSILQNFDVAIDSNCTFLIDDLKYVEVNQYGDIDKTKDKHRSHLLDCFRYCLNTFHSHLLKVQFTEIEEDEPTH